MGIHLIFERRTMLIKWGLFRVARDTLGAEGGRAIDLYGPIKFIEICRPSGSSLSVQDSVFYFHLQRIQIS